MTHAIRILLLLGILYSFVSNKSIAQTVIFSEDFESCSEAYIRDGAPLCGWNEATITSSDNSWAVSNNNPITGSMSLTIGDWWSGTYYDYYNADNCNKIAYISVNATGYTTLFLDFKWRSNGESTYDYGKVVYSTNGGSTWNDVSATRYESQSTTQTVTGLALPAAVDNSTFLLGFRWINDGSWGTNPPFTVDDISVWVSCSVTSGSISASVDPICYGSSSTLTLSGYTGGSTLQWQSSPDGSTWSNIGGATSATYVASPGSDTYYRVAVTNGCTVYTSSYLLDVSNSTAGTASAGSTTVCSGSSPNLTLTGSNGSIQWQSSTDGSTWSDIGGATSSTYNPTPGSNIYYRAKVTDAPCAAVYSNSLYITVNTCVNMQNGSTASCTGTIYDSGGSGSPYSNSEDYTYTINPGSTVTLVFNSFDVETYGTTACGYDYLEIYDGPTTGSPLLGRWCNDTGSPGTIVSSGGSLTLKWHSDGFTTRPGWDADWTCCSVNGGTVSASADPICNGSSSTLTVSGYTGGSTLQWQSSADGSTWSDIGGATSATYVASPGSNTYYRCEVTNGCISYSTSLLLDVSTSTAGTASAGSTTVCSGSSPNLTLAGYSGSIQWQSSTDGSTWSDIGGATSASYNPTPGSDIYYRAKVTDAPCAAVYSNSLFITVVGTCVNMTNGSTASCTGLLYDDGGPSVNYTASKDYTYTINPGATVTITFNSFDVESHATCGYDYLQIYDGPTTASTLLGTWCNTTGSPGTIVSSGGALTLKWHSDSGTELAGWEAEWSCCGVAGGSASASPSSMCVAGNATLTLTGHDGAGAILWQESSDGSTWSDIAGATTSSEVVAVSTTTYYRAQVTNGCDSYSSTVLVTTGGTIIPGKYYVNDNSTSGDVYCTNVGSAANNGQNPCSPKTSVQDIINSYDLEPGDTIFIDAGTYTMGADVTSTTDMGDATGDVVFKGAGSSLTIITAPASDDNFYFFDLLYMRVSDMKLVSTQTGRYNVHIYNGNYNHVDNCVLETTAGTNVMMSTDPNETYDIDLNSVSNCTITNSSATGYCVALIGDADNDTIRNCTITSTGTGGAKAIFLEDYSSGLADEWPTQLQFFNNTVTADDWCIYSSDASGGNTSEMYQIYNNTFTLTSSNQTDGAHIWIENHGIASADESNIYNNVFTGGKYGLYFTNGADFIKSYNNYFCDMQVGVYVADAASDNNDLYHNSFYTTQQCYLSLSTGNTVWNIKNNIFYTTGNSSYEAVRFTGSSLASTIDGNLYYVPNGARYGYLNGSTYATLAAWQGVNKDDAVTLGEENAVSTDPNYQDATSCDLDLTGNYQTGVGGTGVGSDIYGTGRTHPTIGAWEEGSPLPVELADFEAICLNEKREIVWTTLSESNSDYFQLLKSFNGIDYEVFDVQQAAGISNAPQYYSVSDRNVEQPGYYKLIQFDRDGNFETYGPIYSDCEVSSKTELLGAYPNPFNDKVSIRLSSGKDQDIRITVKNAAGKIVLAENETLYQGVNVIDLDLSFLAKGMYIIELSNREFTYHEVIKMLKN